jgi:hypothetical protein
MEATRKKHASHTWRAILNGREVLKQGLIRRIGDGTTTDIWKHVWFQNGFEGQPFTSPDGLAVEKVVDLVTASGQWDKELIRNNFLHLDAEVILRTPMLAVGKDCWAWAAEKHGCYSIRSAYKLLLSKRDQQTDINRGSSSSSDEWKRVWTAEVPPKVQVFWWRVIHGYLSVRQILRRRHIERVANCELCGAEEELTFHVLVQCTMARRFWEAMRNVTGVKLPRLHPVTWAKDLLDTKVCSKGDATVIMCGMWTLWTARNDRRHGESPLPLHLSVAWAKDTAYDLWRIRHPDRVTCQPRVRRTWEKPELGWVKCNSDAAFYADLHAGASGAVLRNHEGDILAGRAKLARWPALIARLDLIKLCLYMTRYSSF